MKKVKINVRMNARPDLDYAYGRVVSWLNENGWGSFEIAPPVVTGYLNGRQTSGSVNTAAAFAVQVVNLPEDYDPVEVDL